MNADTSRTMAAQPKAPGFAPHAALAFDALYERYHRAWLSYAHTQCGSREAAEQVADDVTAQLAETWGHALKQPSVERYAWALLKAAVAGWLAEHDGPAFVETGAFHRVALARHLSKQQFELMEEALGLYSAISELPERQYDVIVLRYVLGYPDSRVAFLLGIDQNTVRSHVRHAKERLAKRLGIGLRSETGE